MVLEGVASSLLQRLLGDYVTGFDGSSVKFSFSGELTLNNLQLKRSALDKLGLPIKVKAGTLSKLFLKVPWTSLGSQPVLIDIDELHLLVVPASVNKGDVRSPETAFTHNARFYDEAEAEQYEQSAKQRKLALAETYKLSRKQISGSNMNDEGWIKRTINTILSTLQVSIKKLHIRYEDPGNNTLLSNNLNTSIYSKYANGIPNFAIGVVIESLQAVSTDSNWAPSSSSGAGYEPILYKILSIKGVFVYFDVQDKLVLAEKPIDDSSEPQFNAATFMDNMNRCMQQRSDGLLHKYLLEPTLGQVKLSMNKRASNFRYPQFLCSLMFDKVSISLRDKDYQCILYMFQRIELWQTSKQWIKWRPSKSPTEAPAEWWSYAINCVRHHVKLKNRPWMPSTLDERRVMRESYVPLYRKLWEQPKYLTPQEKLDLDQLEKKMPFEDIMFFRSLAEIQTNTNKKKAEATPRVGWGSWISSWWNASGPTSSDMSQSPQDSDPAATVISEPKPIASRDSYWSFSLNDSEWAELREAIDYNNFDRQETSNLKPPSDYVHYQVDWSQTEGRLELLVEDQSLSSFTFNQLQIHVEVQESQSLVSTTLGSIGMTDNFSPKTTFPQIVYPQCSSDVSKLIQFSFIAHTRNHKEKIDLESSLNLAEKQHQDVDFELDLKLNRLNIVTNMYLTKAIVDFFTPKLGQSRFSYSSSTSVSTANQGQHKSQLSGWGFWVRSQRRNQRLLALAKLNKTFKICVDIAAPNIIIPKNCSQSDASLLLIVLGNLNIQTKLSPHQNMIKSPSQSSTASMAASNAPISSNQVESIESTEETPSSSLHPSTPLPPPRASFRESSDAIKLLSPIGMRQGDTIQIAPVDVAEYYDRYDLTISDVSIIMTRSEKLKIFTSQQNVAKSQLLMPVNLSLSLAVCKINVATLPNIKINAVMPSLRFQISSTKLMKMLDLISFLSSEHKRFTTPSTTSQGADSHLSTANALPDASLSNSSYFKFANDLQLTEALAFATDKQDHEEMIPLGILVSVKAELPEIQLTLLMPYSKVNKFNSLSQSDQSTSTPEIFKLKMINLGYTFEAYSNSMRVLAHLKSVSVEDCLQDIDSRNRFLVNSVVDDFKNAESFMKDKSDNSPLIFQEVQAPQHPAFRQGLINVDFVHISTSHPSYSGIENNCLVFLDELTVHLNHASITNLMTFIYSVIHSTISTHDISTENIQINSPQSELKQFVEAQTAANPSNPSSSQAEIIDFNLLIKCSAVSVMFLESNQFLADCSLEDLKFQLEIVSNKGYRIKAALRNLEVLDLTKILTNSSEDNHVISVRGSEVVKMTLTNIFEPEESTSTSRGNALYVEVRSIRWLVNPKWLFSMILNIIDVVGVFSSDHTKQTTNSESAELAQANQAALLRSLADGPYIFKWQVKIVNPLIVLPQELHSKYAVIADLGEIDILQKSIEMPLTPFDSAPSNVPASGILNVQNEDPLGPLHRKFRDTVTIFLKGMHVFTGMTTNSLNELHSLSSSVFQKQVLEKTALTMTIGYSWIFGKSQPAFDNMFTLHVDSARIAVSPQQVQMLILATQNILYYEPSEQDINRRLNHALLQEAKRSGLFHQDSNVVETGKVQITFGTITIEGHDHYTLFPSSSSGMIPIQTMNPPKLVEIQLTGSNVSWTTFSNNSLRLSFQVKDLSIFDLRPLTNNNLAAVVARNYSNISSPRSGSNSKLKVKRSVLQPPRIGSNKHLIVGSFVTSPDIGQFSLSVTLNHAQFFPEASFIHHLLSNLMPILNVDLANFLQVRLNVVDKFLTPSQRETWIKSSQHPEAGGLYKIELNRPEFILSDDSSLISNFIFNTNGNSSYKPPQVYTTPQTGVKFICFSLVKSRIELKLLPTFQSYSCKLGGLSASIGELTVDSNTFDDPNVLCVAVAPDGDNVVYHYNVISPVALDARLLLESHAHDYELSFSEAIKASLSHKDYRHAMEMLTPFTLDFSKSQGRSPSSSTSDLKNSGILVPSYTKISSKNTESILTISNSAPYKLVISGFGSATAEAESRKISAYGNRTLQNVLVDESVIQSVTDSGALGITPTLAVPKSVPEVPAFVSTRLQVFDFAIDFTIMDNNEIDQGIARLTIKTDEVAWIEGIGAYSYINSLTPEQRAQIPKLPVFRWSAKCFLNAQCFNMNVGAWEPLIEPYELTATQEDNLITVTSGKLLNLNLTENLVSSYQRYMKAITTFNENLKAASQVPRSNPPESTLDSPRTPHRPSSSSVSSINIITPIKSGFNSTLTTRQGAHSTYFVRNQTGSVLKYRLVSDDTSLSASPETIVENDQEHAVAVPLEWQRSQTGKLSKSNPSSKAAHQLLERDVQASSHRFKIFAQLTGNYLPATDLTVDQLGFQVVELGQGRILVVETLYHLGSKVIIFKSSIGIHNNTMYGLEVGHEVAPEGVLVIPGQTKHAPPKPSANAVKSLSIIPPNQIWYVPIIYAYEATLRFRPVIPKDIQVPPTGWAYCASEVAESYKWSRINVNLKQLKPEQPVFLECYAKKASATEADDSKIFQYCAAISRLANKFAILAGANPFVIHFHPPIVLENVLPTTIAFAITPETPTKSDQAIPSIQTSNNHWIQSSTGKVKKGHKVAIHAMPANCQVFIQISARGFRMSSRYTIRIPSPKGPLAKLDVAKYLVLTDMGGHNLRVMMENHLESTGSRVVSLYTKFWILNKTGLPLLTRADPNKLDSIGAGMRDLYWDVAEEKVSSSLGGQLPPPDVIDDRSGAGIYDGDLRDLFMPDLSAGCLSHSHRESPDSNFGFDPNGNIMGVPVLYDFSATSLRSPQHLRNNNSIPFTCKPMMYQPHGYSNDHTYVKIGESRWSDKQVLNSQNSSTAFSLSDTEDLSRARRKYELVMTIQPANGVFWKTRVVTFSPRYMIINKTQNTIFLRQAGSNAIGTVLPSEHVPWHWLDTSTSDEQFIRIKLNQPHCSWSGKIDPTRLDMYPLAMFDSVSKVRYLVRVLMRLHEETQTTTITFSDEDPTYPLFRIDNFTQATLRVSQKDSTTSQYIQPSSRLAWGWTDPPYNSPVVQVWFNSQDQIAKEYSFAIVENFKPIRFETGNNTVWVRASITTDRTTRVLSIQPFQLSSRKRAQTDDIPNPETSSSSGASLTSSNASSLSTSDQTRTSIDEEESTTNESSYTWKCRLSLAQVSVSIVNAEPIELLYGTLKNIFVEYTAFPSEWSFFLQIRNAQIDNQIPTTFMPVAVFSTAPKPENWLQFSVMRSTLSSDILFQPIFNILLRETTISLDERLLTKLLEFIEVARASLKEESSKLQLLSSNVDILSLGNDEDSSGIIYSQEFLINPIWLKFNFQSSNVFEDSQRMKAAQDSRLLSFGTSNGSAFSLNALLGIPDNLVPSVRNAPIILQGLGIQHSFISSSQLTSRISEHYRRHFMGQLYKLLGSFEALGNPVSLVSNLGAGVKDLFYEPAVGISISYDDFVKGLGRGGKSFLTRSVFGLFYSASAVMSTLGSAVAMASIDSDFQAQRMQQKQVVRPKNAGEGLTQGLFEFAQGVAYGISGIAMDPIKGAQNDGILGFTKGVFTGILGVGTKPIVGVTDLIQRTTEGLSNNVSAVQDQFNRVRHPRFIADDGILREFDPKHSRAMNTLHSLENQKFAHETYWDYFTLRLDEVNNAAVFLLGVFLIASSEGLIYVKRNIDPKTTAKVPFLLARIRYQDIMNVNATQQTGSILGLDIIFRDDFENKRLRIVCAQGPAQLTALKSFIQKYRLKHERFGEFFESMK